MMKTTPLFAFLCWIFLATPPAFSEDNADDNNNSIRTEIVELQQLVRYLTERLSRLEKRLESLENRTPARTPGGHLMFPIEVERGMMFDAYDPVEIHKRMRRLLDDDLIKPIEPRP